MKNFFASCPRGFEETLLKEMAHYNFEHMETTRGGVSFKTSPLKAINFTLESRVASRVYREIGSFQMKNEKELVKAAMEIPWQKILNPNNTFKISSIFSREVQGKFKNSHYLSLLLKDAIVDTFKEKAGKRPNIDLENPDFPFLLRIEPFPKGGFKGIVSVELAGHPLNQRGYREPGHQAPLKENLAAALIMNTEWNRELPLYDIFCGSGTILIEAAYIKFSLPPTFLPLKRRKEGAFKFAFEKQKWFQKENALVTSVNNLCQELITRGEQGLKKAGVSEFYGSDQSTRAIKMLLDSWGNVGLPRKTLRIDQKDALTATPNDDDNNGVLISNPPYGVRLEEKDEKLEELYYELGENLKNNWKGFTAYLISQDPSLRKKISLKTDMRFKFYNGPLECRLLGYKLF